MHRHDGGAPFEGTTPAKSLRVDDRWMRDQVGWAYSGASETFVQIALALTDSKSLSHNFSSW